MVAEHPGLIDQEAFDRVQHMLEPKVRRTRQECRNPIYLVRGALKCGICGHRMTSASTFRSGRLHRYYRCSTRDKQGRAVCRGTRMGGKGWAHRQRELLVSLLLKTAPVVSRKNRG